ncbi:flagellar hook-associated protein FlgL [Fodinisporobacter ferrooxydans]|uniref:Flagellar hook-associated protein FlgL n=1 Tax=Fodinisporobacter ferrooxydans TaxID=2901836 RepID=A0ABY4CLS6_9BACL|nr:flagellar hook-associated protein FlgL [Alicyclobacillaceae bacterium MYW30-H2]
MRITQTMLNQNMLFNLENNTNRLAQYQEQLSTGKKLNAPSDDPVGTGLVLQYKTALAQNDQYTQNAGNAQSWLNNTDTQLSQVSTVMQRIREIAVQAANGTNSADEFSAIGSELEQLKGQLVQVGNSQFDGQYVFNGQMVNQQPYDPNNPTAKDPDTRTIQYQVDENTTIPVNVSGADVFGKSAETDNVFTVLQNLETALKSGNTTTAQSAAENSLSLIDSRISKINNASADVGARLNRVQLITNRLSDSKLNLTKLLSNVQDADMAKVITNLKTAENVQQAALAAGSRIIVSTLVDFLK